MRPLPLNLHVHRESEGTQAESRPGYRRQVGCEGTDLAPGANEQDGQEGARHEKDKADRFNDHQGRLTNRA